VFIKLQHVLCAWGPSSREEMKKAKLQSIELSFANESVLLLGAYDPDQISEWLLLFQKAKQFNEWFMNVKTLLKQCGYDGKQKKPAQLSQSMAFKLKEIVEFCESFADTKDITMISQKQALLNKR
jgi:hypothetical protein